MPYQMIVLSLLSGWKRSHLELAVEEDISLATLLSEHKRDLIRIAKIFALMYSKQKDELNVKNVLTWIRENRPDLYTVFDESKQARLWLTKQVKEVKELLFGG